MGKKSFFENLIFSQFIQQHFAFYEARTGAWGGVVVKALRY